MAILQLIHECRRNFLGALCLLGAESTRATGEQVIHNKATERAACVGASASKFLTYQLSTVGSRPTVALTGDGGLGCDSGEGARETATTSKEGSRRANYPILTQGGSDKK